LTEPIQLIKITFENGVPFYKVNPEALKILSSIETEIAVASFCGRQGLGKSTLLNFVVG
jgi:putative ribosome biogenesis GTPase RsgA